MVVSVGIDIGRGSGESNCVIPLGGAGEEEGEEVASDRRGGDMEGVKLAISKVFS